MKRTLTLDYVHASTRIASDLLLTAVPQSWVDIVLSNEYVKSVTTQKGYCGPMVYLSAVCLALYVHVQYLQFIGAVACPMLTIVVSFAMPATVALFIYATQSSPGFVEKRPVGHSAVEDFLAEFDNETLPTEAKLNRICNTCWIQKGLRTKHCSESKRCVAEFDHFCGWLGLAVGRGNNRTFAALCLSDFLAQSLHAALIVWCTSELVSNADDVSGFFGTMAYLAGGYTLMFISLLSHIITIPWLFLLGSYHARLILKNLTTNEVMNMGRYDHFWIQTSAENGQVTRDFVNPFDKGGSWNNCVDFWWWRTRGEEGEYRRVPQQDGGFGFEMNNHHHHHEGCKHHHHGHAHGGDKKLADMV